MSAQLYVIQSNESESFSYFFFHALMISARSALISITDDSEAFLIAWIHIGSLTDAFDLGSDHALIR